MFIALPIRDSPNPPGRPLVTWGLIAVNVVVYVLFNLPMESKGADLRDPATLEYLRVLSQLTGVSASSLARSISAYDVFVFNYGYRPGSPSLVALFSSMFMHGGLMHLGGNMLFLWIFGDNVEHHLGRGRFILAYLAMGVVATLTFSLFRMDSQIPLVGASGAISGVLGCYFVWFPRNQVKVLTIIIWFINVITVPARWVLGFYILVENLLPFLFQSSGGGVAYGAHIGGFLAGIGVAQGVTRFPALGNVLGMRRDPIRARAAYEPQAHPPSTVGATTAEVFARAVEAESFEQALRLYSGCGPVQLNLLDSRDILALTDWLQGNSAYDAALVIVRRYIATHPAAKDLPAFHLRAGLIQLRGLERPTAAYQHLLSVLDLGATEAQEQQARAAIAEIESGRKRVLH